MENKERSDEWVQFLKRPRKAIPAALAILVILVSIWIVFTAIGWAAHRLFTRSEELPELVKQIQADIDKINDNTKSDWKVKEAEVEVSFALTTRSGGGADVKAVSSELGTERESGHHLTLKLVREAPPTRESGVSSGP